SIRYLEEARVAAEAASDVAKQLGQTGAMSKIDQAREHVFYAELSGQIATARLRQRRERERMVRALGLWGDGTKFTLPAKLPRLPPKPRSMDWVEREAVSRRADLVIARMEIDIVALQLGLTRKTHFINALEVTGITKTERDVRVHNGLAEVDKISRRGFALDV